MEKLGVDVALDNAPRTVDVLTALQEESNKNKAAQIAFDNLSPSKKKAMVLSIIDAKTEETRIKRIEKVIQTLIEA